MAFISGTAGNNLLNGTANADVILGRAGDDTINGLAGDDALFGNAGNDTVSGGAGDDLVFGNRGNDVLRGGLGDDRLEGGAGRRPARRRARPGRPRRRPRGGHLRLQQHRRQRPDAVDLGRDRGFRAARRRQGRPLRPQPRHHGRGKDDIDVFHRGGDTFLTVNTDRDRAPEFVLKFEGNVTINPNADLIL